MNTPNKITLARICLIPLVIFFYLASFIPWGQFIAGMIFVIACVTDFLDGYLARKNNQVTTLGKFLDPIADKILIMSALILIIAAPVVGGVNSIIRPEWVGVVCAIIILAREFAVSTLRQVAATKGFVLAAEKSGKYKAAFQDVTLALYFFYAFYVVEFYKADVEAHATANAVISIILLVFLVIATILTISSGIGYFHRNWKVFSDKKEAKKEDANMVLFVENAKEEPVKEEAKPQTTQAKPKTTPKSTGKKKTTKKPVKKTTPKPKSTVTTADKNGRMYDELIPIALDLFCQKGWASTTMLQKHLGVGYPRASKIVDQMEELGLVSSNQGAKTRQVLVSKQEFEKNNTIFK